LRNSEVFRNLDDAALDWLSEVAVRRGYQRGLLVFSHGDCGGRYAKVTLQGLPLGRPSLPARNPARHTPWLLPGSSRL